MFEHPNIRHGINSSCAREHFVSYLHQLPNSRGINVYLFGTYEFIILRGLKPGLHIINIMEISNFTFHLYNTNKDIKLN